MSIAIRKPTFSLDSVKRTRRKGSNPYTDMQDLRPLWKVTFKNDVYTDRSIELFFELEAQVYKVPKGPISESQLFGYLVPYDTAFVVKDIRKGEREQQLNQYTDAVGLVDMWEVMFESEIGPMPYASLWYPNEKEASLFGIGRRYGPLDFLKTFRIIVTWFPTFDNYIAEYFPEGYFDKDGYHVPGAWPHGMHTTGYYTGTAVNLEPVDPSIGGLGTITYLLYTFPGGFAVLGQDGSVQRIKF